MRIKAVFPSFFPLNGLIYLALSFVIEVPPSDQDQTIRKFRSSHASNLGFGWMLLEWQKMDEREQRRELSTLESDQH